MIGYDPVIPALREGREEERGNGPASALPVYSNPIRLAGWAMFKYQPANTIKNLVRD
jgi:hypothetical protein